MSRVYNVSNQGMPHERKTMGTLQVQVSQKIHRKFKKRCFDMEIYQGEVIAVLVELFTEGHLDLPSEQVEKLVMQSRGIQDGDICGSHNAAKYLSVSVPTVRRMIEANQLKVKKIPPIHGGLVFRRMDLDRAKRIREK